MCPHVAIDEEGILACSWSMRLHTAYGGEAVPGQGCQPPPDLCFLISVPWVVVCVQERPCWIAVLSVV